MTGLFVLVGTLATVRTGDHALAVMSILGVLLSVCRLLIMFRGRQRFDAQAMTAAAARRFERSFAVFYVGFATMLGAFAARVITLPSPDLHTPVAILIVGYAAGVAATMALRPLIALPSLVLSVGPVAIAIGWQTTPEDIVSAVCLVALLAGGLRSIDRRNQSQHAGATTREASLQLAQRDHLTGLGNRLALSETLAMLRRSGPESRQIAVHYVDLDDFKPINDQLGHLAGDALLQALAGRLRSELTEDDVTVRIGGDEFVYVQTMVCSHADVVERALRLETALQMPLRLDGHLLVVGASVGSSGPWPIDTDLRTMLKRSDDALRARKIQRKGTASPARTSNVTAGWSGPDGTAIDIPYSPPAVEPASCIAGKRTDPGTGVARCFATPTVPCRLPSTVSRPNVG
ncbi:GGDEF domain-containing protein [Sphingomonas sp. CFBP 8760]|uniref:GGDEF domain-containing protein n=1 Tax=Sphingomonas sp. CFBP 8760 TaxID=2775282 RepID=UPI0017869116|nr:GGDEF domain-containing protein [Sphingomonas sp. CFBP 8760]MBD8548305.1 diguanylate cyclase [Sphingomonas sp. CFBP 8760]